MGRKTQYEYDAKAQVLIRISTSGSPMVASRTEPHRGNLGSKYESYAQAIYRGHGMLGSARYYIRGEDARDSERVGMPAGVTHLPLYKIELSNSVIKHSQSKAKTD